MKIVFYGVRGSIATPGPATARYGGNTVCVEVRLADGSLLILDAGTGVRKLGLRLMQGPLPNPINVLITHVHWDHIIGAPFFEPLWRKDARIVLHSFSQNAHDLLRKKILFDGIHFPVPADKIPADLQHPPAAASAIRIGSATIRSIRLNHPGGADGFRVDDDDGTSLCYLTDNELLPAHAPATVELARFAADAKFLIHDAQYLPGDFPSKRGWGHSQIADVLELGRAAGVENLVLFHHDPSRDDDALDAIANDAAQWARVHAPQMNTIVAAEDLVL